METKEETEKSVEKALQDFTGLVAETARRLPETKYVVVEPRARPAVDCSQND